MKALRHGLAISFLFTAIVAFAQKDLEQGVKALGSYSGGDIDSVSITNGNLYVHVPLLSYPQRGGKLKFSFALQANSKGWYLYTTTSTPPVTYWKWGGGGINVVRDQTLAPSIISQRICGIGGDPYTCQTLKFYSERSTDGGSHHVHGRSTDLSGVTLVGGGLPNSIDNEGVRYTYTGSTGMITNASTWINSEDPNGNKITASATGWTDTLGRALPGVQATDNSYGIYNASSVLPGVSTTNYTGCPTGAVAARNWNVPAPSGGTATIKFCFNSYSLSTNFGIPAVNEGAATDRLMSAAILPDGTKWLFSYNSYGDVASITLPTGGTISYTWGTLAFNNVSASRTVLTRTVNANDGSPAATWTYTRTSDGSGLVIVTDPVGNDTEHRIWAPSLQGPLAHGSVVDRVRSFQGTYTAGTLLKTVLTTYANEGYDYCNDYADGQSTDDVFPLLSIRPTAVTTTLQYGTTTKVETDWDLAENGTWTDPVDGSTAPQNVSYGSALQQRDYAYGAGAPGSLLRKTVRTYLWQSDSSTLSNNLLALASTVQVQDPSSNRVAETDHYYDQTSVVSSGVTTQHNTTPTATKRGNETTLSRWLTGTTFLSSTATYFDTGMVQTATDPGGHAATYAYDTTTLKGAYLTGVTLPNTTNDQGTVTHSTSANFDFNTGLMTSSTDENGQQTTFSYDTSFRLTQKSLPSGGQVSWSYTSSTPFKVTVTTKITSTMNSTQEAEIDNLGRVIHTRLTSDPDSSNQTDYTDTTYDIMGRVSTVSNPYRVNTEATYGVTTTQYDALGRTIKTIPTDGTSSTNSVATSYNDNCATITDQAGKTRKSCTDAQGRLIQVFEPNASGSFLYETDYQYDLLDNLARVDQKGNDANSANWRTRTFTYDALSRLTQSNNPEAGTINYTYDSDGNVVLKDSPQPNQTNVAVRQYITYCYDELHRQTKKYYSNTSCTTSSPPVTYLYDQTSYNSLTITNGKAHRTGMSDGSGQTAWSYDSVGAVLIEKRTIGAVTKTTTNTYNLDGSAATVIYPSGRTITYSYSAAGRLLSAVDATNSINYVTGATYSPWGEVTGAKYGVTGTFNGIVTTNTYNKRIQPITLSAAGTGTGSQTVLSLTFDFGLNTANNGDVYGVTNNRDNSRSVAYAYDELNRIKSATSQATSGTNCWGQLFGHLDGGGNYVSGYDIWGNLKEITVSQCSAQALSVSIDAGTNRVTNTGYSYDAAGNVMADGTNSYYYDAENRVCSAGGTSCTTGTYYTYDGDGNRVKKSSGKLYWGLLSESDASGNLTADFIFFGGRRIARLDLPGGAIHYFFSDHLGSSNVVTNADGTTIQEESDYYPFGKERVISDTLSDQNFKLMGKERDLESGLDFFGARYYNSSSGRWLSPDWSNSPAAVPYATLLNPQTLNLYAFVANNPATNVELDGHAWAWLRHESEYVVPTKCQVTPEACAELAGPVLAGTAANGDPILTETQEALLSSATDSAGRSNQQQQQQKSDQNQQKTETVIAGQRPLKNPILRFFFGKLFKHSYIRFTEGGVTHQMEVLGGDKRGQQVRDTYGTEDQSHGKETVVHMTPAQKMALVERLEYYAGSYGGTPHECPSCGANYHLLWYNSNSFVYNMLSHNPAGPITPPSAPAITPGYGSRGGNWYDW